jgi:type II secretory pathway pseudopilin PulG
MKLTLKKDGFSLTEVLLAIGTLAIGMTFISGTFLAGIYLSTISTERTIAAIVADEAFAKIRLYGINPSDVNLPVNRLTPFESLNALIPAYEFAYPSTRTQTDKQYYWSALCRPVYSNPDNRLFQVTVFISRKVGSGTRYPGDSDRPVPVEVGVSLVAGGGNENKLTINTAAQQAYINDGYRIVDNRTGNIYRVLRQEFDTTETIVLDRPWQGGSVGSVWVVPPPIGGGRNPGIAIYQKVIRF